jgi:hypothetical protein
MIVNPSGEEVICAGEQPFADGQLVDIPESFCERSDTDYRCKKLADIRTGGALPQVFGRTCVSVRDPEKDLADTNKALDDTRRAIALNSAEVSNLPPTPADAPVTLSLSQASRDQRSEQLKRTLAIQQKMEAVLLARKTALDDVHRVGRERGPQAARDFYARKQLAEAVEGAAARFRRFSSAMGVNIEPTANPMNKVQHFWGINLTSASGFLFSPTNWTPTARVENDVCIEPKTEVFGTEPRSGILSGDFLSVIYESPSTSTKRATPRH